MLQCVAECCSVLQCVAACCRVLQCVAVCYNVLQRVAVCCSVLQFVTMCCSVLHTLIIDQKKDTYISNFFKHCNKLQHTAIDCNRLTYQFLQTRTFADLSSQASVSPVAACCSVLQCVAASCSVTLLCDTFFGQCFACCSALQRVAECCSVL